MSTFTLIAPISGPIESVGVIRVAGSLLACLILALGGALVAKRFKLARCASHEGQLQLVDRTRLDAKTTVYLIRCEGHSFLLAAGLQSLTWAYLPITAAAMTPVAKDGVIA